MMETAALIGTIVTGYKGLRVWHDKQMQPAHLPVNAILLFQRFKTGYDGKDINQLAACISDDYLGECLTFCSSRKTKQLFASNGEQLLGRAATTTRLAGSPRKKQ